jgi:quinol-cytochrome oxidoreductase complex cytochrome b subunit
MPRPSTKPSSGARGTGERPPGGTPGLAHRIWRSIFRGPIRPESDRERKWIVVNNFVLHFRPVRVTEKTLRYAHTFGLGGMSLVLVLLLICTGVLMMFGYEPSPEGAYASVTALERDVLFGRLVRSVHHWSANFLIAVVVLHLLRTYFTGAYFPPRQFNWVLGLGLLLCVLASNFTGYLLPWDQLSYWAITISTGMIGYVPAVGEGLERMVRGGPDIGRATLITFYTLHTTIVPVLIVVLMAFHFWRVRKARGVVVPREPAEPIEESPHKVLGLPYLILREFVVALILIAFVMLFAALMAAPLGEAANPGMSPNPAKAPWYFVGIQELLLHFHPVFAVLVLPLLALLALFAIPYVRYDEDTSGIWFASQRGRRLAAWATLLAAVVTPLWIVLDEFVFDLGAWLPGPAVISEGLLPFALLVGVIGLLYWLVRRRAGATKVEAVQGTFVLLFVAFAVLTATGVWFRGPGMALVWP